MDAHVWVPLIGGAVVGAMGVALGLLAALHWHRRGTPARLTFHRPTTGVLVVEVRARISAAYAEELRTWFEREEQRVYGEGASVLLVALDP
jgi:hypothetical protein